MSQKIALDSKVRTQGSSLSVPFLTARLQTGLYRKGWNFGRGLNQERKLKSYLIKSAVNDSPFTKKNPATISVYD